MPKSNKAIPWSEEALDALVEISESDIERAAVMWRTHAPEEATDILDAEPTEQI